MKTRFLFPYWCKFLGLALILLHMPVMHLRFSGHHDFHFDRQPGDTSMFDGPHLHFIIAILLMVIGLLLVAFSREKVEDEHISQLRLDSLQWAVYLNYLVLILTAIFMTRDDFEDILWLNLWVPLAFFIIRFRWMLFRLNRSVSAEDRR
ncbi:MAG TPA: hypothetical protein VHA56_00620 [Mucilaginibacter sp.]|nr:hypothetical protein [Mucilaginibacter sp.]